MVGRFVSYDNYTLAAINLILTLSIPSLITSLFLSGKTFERKMEELVGLVAQSVGLPVLARKTHKYLLASPPWAQVTKD